MNLEIRAQEGTGPELYRWLVNDPDVSASITAADSGDGEMGIGFDILNLAVPNAIALGNLIVAIATYRASRQQSTGNAPQVSIGHADTFVLVEGDGSNAVKALARDPESL